MGGADFLEGPVIGLGDQFIQQLIVHEVRTGELLSVAGQLVHEGGGRIHAKVLGRFDLEFEVDEQLHVLVEALIRDEAVAVVLLEDVGEILG